jgi:hypothetical protein
VGAACGTTSTPDLDGGTISNGDASTDAPHDAASDHDAAEPFGLCPGDGSGAGVDAASLPQCGHDPTIVPDAAVCTAARAFVVCCYASGATAICISDDPSTCGPDTILDGGAKLCTTRCAPNEYAVQCGGGIEPTGCRTLAGPAPGGGATFSCCPCR